MWVGTLTGLSELIPSPWNRFTFRNYSVANGLSEAQIYQLSEDRDGNLWLGTRSGGVMKMARQGFITYGTADGFRQGDFHRSIFETIGGRLVVTTSVGGTGLVQEFDGKRFTATEIRLPKPDAAAGTGLESAIQDRAGEWWIGARQGLLHFGKAVHGDDLGRNRPQTVYSTASGLPDSHIWKVYEDVRGDIWSSLTGAN